MTALDSNANALGSLTTLRREATQAPDKAIVKVARQFEGVMLQQMLKSMRDSIEEGGLTSDESTKTYMGMLDNQLATQIASTGGIGLAKVIERQLTQTRTSQTTDTAAVPASTPQAEALRLQLRTRS